ncbi:prolyl-tRNA synthetase associated domain-containing protein [Paenibacillus taichungensis]|uniref:prolyl-tRNA synthetase associated domain-containing protein n=1 Tax=Paenibacillus taichungensis TaxID=484184 RepID=UPI0035DC3F64
MFFISDIYRRAPSEYKTVLQEKTYRTLQDLQIPFERVDTDEAITMEDCVHINKKMDMRIVKTLFLCNRQQTAFYLFITAGDKPFKSKEFSNAIGVSRVSFAPSDLMENMLGTKIGAATVFSALFDNDNAIQIVLDKEITCEEWYGCSDGTTTGYMKIKTSHIMHDFLTSVKHTPYIVEV